jgi:hypothetical protein
MVVSPRRTLRCALFSAVDHYTRRLESPGDGETRSCRAATTLARRATATDT